MTRLLVTRPRPEAASLGERLRRSGFETICVPTISIEPADDGSLARALGRAERFDWLIVTSANAVPPLASRVPPGVRVAAVGTTTAAALLDAGMRVDHVPTQYRSAAIAAGLGDLQGRRVLLARADTATPELRRTLRDAGARVTEAIAYRTVEGPPASRGPLQEALATNLDAIVFSSASAVRGLLALLDAGERAEALRIPALCIGPVTAGQAKQVGFSVPVVAEEHTGIGLVRAVAAHFEMGAIA